MPLPTLHAAALGCTPPVLMLRPACCLCRAVPRSDFVTSWTHELLPSRRGRYGKRQTDWKLMVAPSAVQGGIASASARSGADSASGGPLMYRLLGDVASSRRSAPVANQQRSSCCFRHSLCSGFQELQAWADEDCRRLVALPDSQSPAWPCMDGETAHAHCPAFVPPSPACQGAEQ